MTTRVVAVVLILTFALVGMGLFSISPSGLQNSEIAVGAARKAVSAEVSTKASSTIQTSLPQTTETESTAVTSRRSYIRLSSRALATVDQGSLHYLHDDLVTSDVAITDNNAGTTNKEEFLAFGESTSSSVSGYASPRKYAGMELDESDLYYAGARTYLPKIGRFHQTDPILRAGESNYAYVMNNPVRYRDPLGLESINLQKAGRDKYVDSLEGGIGYGGGIHPFGSPTRSFETTGIQYAGFAKYASELEMHGILSSYLQAGHTSFSGHDTVGDKLTAKHSEAGIGLGYSPDLPKVAGDIDLRTGLTYDILSYDGVTDSFSQNFLLGDFRVTYQRPAISDVMDKFDKISKKWKPLLDALDGLGGAGVIYAAVKDALEDNPELRAAVVGVVAGQPVEFGYSEMYAIGENSFKRNGIPYDRDPTSVRRELLIGQNPNNEQTGSLYYFTRR